MPPTQTDLAAAVAPAPDPDAAGRLRVTAVGTSNMVLRSGFRQVLENDPRILFRNFAVGASGTVLLGLRLDQAPLDETDVLVLEFAVNEERFVPEGTSSIEAVTNAMRFAVDKACRAGCVPVLMVLPHRQFLGAAPVADAMKAVFERAGLPIFDVAGAVLRCAQLTKVEPASLFRDVMHLKPSVARAFSVLLIEALRSLALHRRKALMETVAFRPIRFLSVTELLGDDHPGLFKRRSRLIEADVVHLKAGETVFVPSLGDRTSVVGVLSNSARTRGLLLSEDGDKLHFHMPEARWSDDPAAFTLVARPLAPIRVPRTGKQFTVAPLRSAQEDEPPQIEFCGLFLRVDGERKRMASAPLPRFCRDLSASIDETALRLIATLAQD